MAHRASSAIKPSGTASRKTLPDLASIRVHSQQSLPEQARPQQPDAQSHPATGDGGPGHAASGSRTRPRVKSTLPQVRGQLALPFLPWRPAPARVAFAPVLRMRGQGATLDTSAVTEIDRVITQAEEAACPDAPSALAKTNAIASESASLGALRQALSSLLAGKDRVPTLREQVISAVKTAAANAAGTPKLVAALLAEAMRALADAQANGHPAGAVLQADLVEVARRIPGDGRLAALLAVYCSAGPDIAAQSAGRALSLLRLHFLKLDPTALQQALTDCTRLDWWRPSHGIARSAAAFANPPALSTALLRLLIMMDGALPLCPAALKSSFLEKLMASMCRHRQASDTDEGWDYFIDCWARRATGLDDERFAQLMLALHWPIRFIPDQTLSLRVWDQVLSCVEDWLDPPSGEGQAQDGEQAGAACASFTLAEPFIGLITGYLRQCLGADAQARLHLAQCASTLARLLEPLCAQWARTSCKELELIEKEARDPSSLTDQEAWDQIAQFDQSCAQS